MEISEIYKTYTDAKIIVKVELSNPTELSEFLNKFLDSDEKDINLKISKAVSSMIEKPTPTKKKRNYKIKEENPNNMKIIQFAKEVGREFKLKEVAETLGKKSNEISFYIQDLIMKGSLKKVSRGTYQYIFSQNKGVEYIDLFEQKIESHIKATPKKLYNKHILFTELNLSKREQLKTINAMKSLSKKEGFYLYRGSYGKLFISYDKPEQIPSHIKSDRGASLIL
jgi:hypothetical protein